ncbi:acyl-coenzyme A amino acid N-acyltransferase 2-like isoform X3 [Anneissia japonica]|uniref:acyl-coenzyme A amino acid N-acyltransferase 2-like isoform X3 n=1 Tax=Anneissia japonica TaxID=1529436 RepID=UPI00142574CB|nr:acyl-coenzyme A amino acid N-acyltransferase 2-like isoform X3 [Anneissia japonica]
MAELIVMPTSAFIDEKMSIHVYGLQKSRSVTIRAFVDERGRNFEAYAHFHSDVNGTVQLDSHPSLCGSYRGVMPMGLFSHMQPSPGQKAGVRLVKKNVTTPLVFDLTVYEGFLSTEEFYSRTSAHKILAKTTVERWYMAKDVERIEIKSGNIRGTLFKPKGDGPFPGIIDMFGTAGGIMEFRAALFSSYGFACLSLPFFGYEDLTKNPVEVDMVYFEEAVDWLVNNPLVMDSGIGIIGVSAGAQTVLKLATICGSKIKACVCINGSPFYTPDEPSRLYKGKVQPTLNVSRESVFVEEDGVFNVTRYWPNKPEDIDHSTMMNLEDSSCQFLFIAGEEDKTWSSKLFSTLACKYLQKHGKSNWKILSYPGAGHLIEPPYAPLCHKCYVAISG